MSITAHGAETSCKSQLGLHFRAVARPWSQVWDQRGPRPSVFFSGVMGSHSRTEVLMKMCRYALTDVIVITMNNGGRADALSWQTTTATAISFMRWIVAAFLSRQWADISDALISRTPCCFAMLAQEHIFL